MDNEINSTPAKHQHVSVAIMRVKEMRLMYLFIGQILVKLHFLIMQPGFGRIFIWKQNVIVLSSHVLSLSCLSGLVLLCYK